MMLPGRWGWGWGVAEQDIDPSVHRRKLRNILRQLREESGKTQSATADAMSWSVSKLIRIESGSVTISVNDLRALLQCYDVTEPQRVEALIEMTKLARKRSWLNAYKGIASDVYLSYLAYEELAVTSRNFQPVLVPGLLQTEEYAASIVETIRGPKIPRRLNSLVQLRILRQERVFSRTDLDLHFLLDESAIRRPVRGPDVMSRQLRHLLDISERDNVSLGVIPFSVGFYRSIRVPFVVFQFGQIEDEAILYLEYPQGEEIIREDVPVDDGTAADGPTTPPTYLEIFAELEHLTSADTTVAILEDALRDLAS
jgi:transcriptional regulator with XRE-family HTH domain